MATITSPRPGSPAIPTITSPSTPSATNTPTSSHRPSIDLPSSQNVPGNAATNQRRNRAALRDYYNLKSKAAAGTSPAASTHNLSRTASIASTTSDSTQVSSATIITDAGGRTALPSTLDDPSFDAEAYITDLLKTSTLKDILRTESSLVSEIRNLTGERKALVYDNYSKLIVAVGTIGEMQREIVEERGQNGQVSGLARMKGLEGKLDSLMDDFRDQVGGSEFGQRDESARKANAEQKRMRQNERMKKELVNWVLNAPSRLSTLIKDNKKDEAEKEWERVQDLLEKWDGVEGVSELRDRCHNLMPAKDDSDD